MCHAANQKYKVIPAKPSKILVEYPPQANAFWQRVARERAREEKLVLRDWCSDPEPHVTVRKEDDEQDEDEDTDDVVMGTRNQPITANVGIPMGVFSLRIIDQFSNLVDYVQEGACGSTSHSSLQPQKQQLIRIPDFREPYSKSLLGSASSSSTLVDSDGAAAEKAIATATAKRSPAAPTKPQLQITAIVQHPQNSSRIICKYRFLDEAFSEKGCGPSSIEITLEGSLATKSPQQDGTHQASSSRCDLAGQSFLETPWEELVMVEIRATRTSCEDDTKTTSAALGLFDKSKAASSSSTGTIESVKLWVRLSAGMPTTLRFVSE
jgi:hypothetical protein